MLIGAFATVLKRGLHTDMQGLPGPAWACWELCQGPAR